jgi:DNA-binding MarR family transcriptional regulator
MSRDVLVEDLYRQLNLLIRRSRELGNDLHPGLSLIGYTFLSMVESTPEIRAADLADQLSLDKSTVSRQLNQLFDAGLLDRVGGRPGRRGDPLSLTRAGRRALANDAERVRCQLTGWVADWPDADVALLASLMCRFNASVIESLAS